MANFSRQNQGIPSNDNLADITVVTGRIDNVESGLVGNLSLASIDINGGTIDGTTVGATTPSTGAFTTLDSSTLSVTGTVSGTISYDAGATFSSSVVVVGSLVASASFDIGTTLVVGSSISTAGNEAIKMDIILGTLSVASDATDTVSVAHGKGANIRGACAAAYASGGSTYGASISTTGVDATNVKILVSNGIGSTQTISYAVTVFYI